MFRRRVLAAVGFFSALAIVALGQSAAHAGAASPASAVAHATKTYKMYVTLYGAYDNTPPDSDQIAYPQIHSVAGGTGTYSDPITFATDESELSPGTKVYVTYMKRYFIMEDDCTECDEDWTSSDGPSAPGYNGPGYRRIDLWAGNSHNSKITNCEDNLTLDSQTSVIVNPPSNETVVTTPIFNSSTLKCWSSS